MIQKLPVDQLVTPDQPTIDRRSERVRGPSDLSVRSSGKSVHDWNKALGLHIGVGRQSSTDVALRLASMSIES